MTISYKFHYHPFWHNQILANIKIFFLLFGALTDLYFSDPDSKRQSCFYNSLRSLFVFMRPLEVQFCLKYRIFKSKVCLSYLNSKMWSMIEKQSQKPFSTIILKKKKSRILWTLYLKGFVFFLLLPTFFLALCALYECLSLCRLSFCRCFMDSLSLFYICYGSTFLVALLDLCIYVCLTSKNIDGISFIEGKGFILTKHTKSYVYTSMVLMLNGKSEMLRTCEGKQVFFQERKSYSRLHWSRQMPSTD